MFDTVLVADRGASAIRVIRSCQQLNIKTVAVYVEDDRAAAHVGSADERLSLGQTMDTRAVLEAAGVSGAQAIHPGGSPSAADPAFAQAVLDAGLRWLGAPPEFLSAGVASLPTERGMCLEGGATGWTVLGAWQESVRRDGRVLVTESAPHPAELPESVLALGDASTSWLGTAYGDTLWPSICVQDRLVELTTGVDLVERALRVACGGQIAAIPAATGHAIQAALYAASDATVPVHVQGWVAPTGEHLRVDTVLVDGGKLGILDGPLLATVTAHGQARPEALARLIEAMGSVQVHGPPTDLALLSAVLAELDVV